MLTDNRVIVECMRELPALMCVQRKAKKIVPTEEDIIRSNIASFGDDIGKITNRVTAMYEIQSRYPSDSREYKTLAYRIQCGQLLQQNSIDRAKGIISKPMPKYWYDRAAIWKDETMTQEEKEFQNRIVANKKPYFMRYIYPAVMKQYKTYIQNTDMKAMCLFMKTIPELEAQEERTAEEQEFLDYYHDLMPVGTGDSVMNKICRRFEQEFDRYIGKYKSGKTFDYTFMKSKAKYVDSQYRRIKAVLERYIQCLREYSRKAWFDRLSFDETVEARRVMVQGFREECYSICSNRYVLCNILLDLCYTKEGTKQFCWDVVGDVIVDNLLAQNGGTISIPVMEDDGDVSYRGDRFRFYEEHVDWGAI